GGGQRGAGRHQGCGIDQEDPGRALRVSQGGSEYEADDNDSFHHALVLFEPGYGSVTLVRASYARLWPSSDRQLASAASFAAPRMTQIKRTLFCYQLCIVPSSLRFTGR